MPECAGLQIGKLRDKIAWAGKWIVRWNLSRFEKILGLPNDCFVSLGRQIDQPISDHRDFQFKSYAGSYHEHNRGHDDHKKRHQRDKQKFLDFLFPLHGRNACGSAVV